MSHRWLLSLLCLSVLFLSLVQLTTANGELRVNEANSRVLLQSDPVGVLLVVENSSREPFKAKVELELLTPTDRVIARSNTLQAIAPGSQTLRLNLPFSISSLQYKEHSQLPWHRLRYRLSNEGSPDAITEGIISLSQMTPDLFELQVAASDVAREGTLYHTRIRAVHPITNKPAANIPVKAEIKFDENSGNVKLEASRVTDENGYASLDFRFPQRSAQFQPAEGELRVIATKGAYVVEAKGTVNVDQMLKTLITTDKPLYQPGQVMHIRALLFSPTKRALTNQNVLIRVTDPEDLTVYRTIVSTSRFGVAATDWPVPENTRLGDYHIRVGAEGGEEGQEMIRDVRISRYDLPNFTVSVKRDRDYYLPGQNAEVRVKADYLFGKPLTRGHVRVVRETDREWNYREQKWEVEEGDKYEGETDSEGAFLARIDLAKDHEDLKGESYSLYQDVTYTAYFTEPTTNRTEQRRFDVRVTKEPIHVHLLNDYNNNRTLPINFFVVTTYADGSPARCKVNLALATGNVYYHQRPPETVVVRQLAQVQTNRYGVAKVSDVRFPSGFESEIDFELRATAFDAQGRGGMEKEEIRFDEDPTLRVSTDKSIYRSGEPITTFITTAAVPERTVIVDLISDSTVIRSERVQLRNGRGSVTFPYKSDFKDRLTIAAYTKFAQYSRTTGVRTILYPRNTDLNVSLRPSQTTYRPGEDAQVSFTVRAPEGRAAESALGVAIIDKAVEERFRTDQEFGHTFDPIDTWMRNYEGGDEQIGGVNLRRLQHLDPRELVPPEMDLIAEILLNQNRNYYPNFYHSDEYETEQTPIFTALVKAELKPVFDALNKRYERTLQYPTDETSLRRFLLESRIDLDQVVDPWGVRFRPVFSLDKQSDVLTLITAGADKKFGSGDDFSVDSLAWRYFIPTGVEFDRAVRKYHERTGGYIRDLPALRDQLAREAFVLDNLRDRWAQPYRFDFKVVDSHYVLNIVSSGTDKKFSSEPGADDFTIWSSPIDYFAESRTRVKAVIDQNTESTGRFPQSDQELRDILRNSGAPLESMRDPWSQPYYATFKTQSLYTDRLRIENTANFREVGAQRTQITPITQTVGFVMLRSIGPDGKAGTIDDFTVATFMGVLFEEGRGDRVKQTQAPSIVLSGRNGAIYGVVTDPNGAVIPNVEIKVIPTFQHQQYQTKTNDEGRYNIADLPPGVYNLRYEVPGFSITVITNVIVAASNLTEVNVTLQVGAVAETVMVTGGPAQFTFSVDGSVNATSTTVRRNVMVVTKAGTSPQMLTTPRLREYFPETLFWQPLLETDRRGLAQINFKLADNITTWKLAVIGSTEDGYIGATETEIKAFQPFFVEHDPPRILTTGDEISLPVVVRNYLDREQKVDLEIKPENWFSLLGPARKSTSVAAGDAGRETFDFRANSAIKDGKQRLTAVAGDANDAIEKPITVHPDGEEQSVSDGNILSSSAAVELTLPENVIPDSTSAELKIYPNLLAHVIEGVEAIMARPYGCGEQTISSTYPSLLLLRRHKETGEVFPLRARAEGYLSLGYSRLLNYRDEKGGFTYWGHGEPDIALTAFALRFLTEANEVMPVDEKVIKETAEWLVKQQRPDGSWKPNLYWTTDAEDKPRTVMLTAYVARILARNMSAEVSPAFKRALDYLAREARGIDEPYLLASYALAALDAQDVTRAKPVVEKLRSLAHREGNTVYWALETNTPFYGWGRAGRIETTALAVQALSRYCAAANANCEAERDLIADAMLFLVKSKDSYGVWYSTQATVNVLDTMLSLLSTTASGQTNASAEAAAEVLVNGRVVKTVQLPLAANRLVSAITVALSEFVHGGRNTIEVKRPGGAPLASMQALANYYVPWADSASLKAHADGARAEATRADGNSLRLQTKFNRTESKVSDEIVCHVEAERVGFRGYGMMLAEIGLPPGADVDRGSIDVAMKASGWAINQYDVLPDRVVFYLWPYGGAVKFDFKFRPRFGLNAKTAPSVVYDYYNPDSRAVVAPAKFTVK